MNYICTYSYENHQGEAAALFCHDCLESHLNGQITQSHCTQFRNRPAFYAEGDVDDPKCIVRMAEVSERVLVDTWKNLTRSSRFCSRVRVYL